MEKNTTKKNPPINTSGWTDEEIAMLDALVTVNGSDRSKVIRSLVRKETTEREHKSRSWKRMKDVVAGRVAA